MGIADWFSDFCSTIQVKDGGTISMRYKRITRRLNTDFWNTTSDVSHSLYVGSYGRNIAAVLDAGRIGAIVGVVVSTALLGLNAYTKNYDLGALAQKHRQVGADLWIIRETYLSLITDLRMGEIPIEALQNARDDLLEKLHAVYAGAPSTTNNAYKKAQEALQRSEDLTFRDDEIDAFLPKELKRGSKSSETLKG
jgi:hypothetical protein